MRTLFLGLVVAVTGAVVASGCRPGSDDATSRREHGARSPAQAVLLPTRHLRDNDLAAFARDAVPPALAPKLEAAWRRGETRWPLDELPFDERLPGLLGALAAPGAEKRLQQVYDHQFSGETTALRAAATALGLFGAQYLEREGDFSDAERRHYTQFVGVLSHWGARAPLSDPARARQAIPQLVAAARATGLRSEADFARTGMAASLARLSGFLRVLKHVLAGYGLDVDASLSGLRAEVVERAGDRAQVRMRYTLGGRPVDAVVSVERIDGRWYLGDYLRHAREAAGEAGEARN